MINDKAVPVSAALLAFLEEWLEWAKSPECADTYAFKRRNGLCESLLRWISEKEENNRSSHHLALKRAFAMGGHDHQYPFGKANYRVRLYAESQHLDPLRLAWVEKTIEVTKNLNNLNTTGGNV